ncbi:MAG: hypothetical protein KY468_17340, partial [Armatimonadetes bacterium]|nr:hypothetical protein [Armatimonadota bacterium]
MIELETQPPFEEGAIDRIQAHFKEPDWLAEHRRAAWRRYDAMPMPDRSDERWRRTDVSKLDLYRVRPLQLLARVETEFGFKEPEEGLHAWADTREQMTMTGVVLGTFEEVMR